MKSILTSLFFLFSNLANAIVHYRADAVPVDEREFEFVLDSDYWQSTSKWDEFGNEFDFSGRENAEKWDNNLTVSYGIHKRWEIFGLLRYRTMRSDTNQVDLKDNGFESYGFGAKYRLNTRSLDYIFALEAVARTTPYTNNETPATGQQSSTEYSLGDDSGSYHIGPYFSYQLGYRSWFNAHVFYHSPPNGLSNEMVYKAGLAFPGERWTVEGGVEGIASLNDDEHSEATRKLEGHGSTNLFNSINRQRFGPWGRISYSFDKWKLGFNYNGVYAGRSTDSGQSFGLRVTWISKSIREKNRIRVRDSQFKEYQIEGSVLKSSPRGKFVEVDRGLAHDLEKGMIVDFFDTDFFGGNKLLATGRVFEVGSEKSIVKVNKIYGRNVLKKGSTMRAQ